MTEQHVGKKRRKEVREAINMKRQINRDLRFTAIVFALAILVVIGCSVVTFSDIFSGNTMIIQTVPLIIVLIAVMAVSFKMSNFWDLRSKYKKHCLKYNITKNDMKALDRGEL